MISHASSEQLSRLIDGDLSLTERTAVLDHLATCPACAELQTQLVDIAASLRAANPPAWSAALTTVVIDEATSRRRDRASLPIAALIAVASITALAFLTPFFTVGRGLLEIAVAVDPIGGAAAVVLIVVALLAPLAAYPLLRWR